MAPEIFIKAYASATTDEFRQSEEAPKIDAKNPAGKSTTHAYREYSVNCVYCRFVLCIAAFIAVRTRQRKFKQPQRLRKIAKTNYIVDNLR